MENTDEAIEVLHKTLTMRKNHYAPEHLLIGQTEMLLARAYKQKNEYDKAEAFARSSIEILSKSVGDTHWRTATAQFTLGSILLEKGNYGEAEEQLIHGYNNFTSQSYQPQETLEKMIQTLIQLYEETGNKDQYSYYNLLLLELEKVQF